MTWKNWLDWEIDQNIVRQSPGNSLGELKEYEDSWDWYDSKTSKLPNYKMRCKEVPCSRVTINNYHDAFQKLNPLPSIFSPAMIGKYLFFCFNELEEDNGCSVYLIFDESLIICLMNLKKEGFGPIWVLHCMFYESKEGKLDGLFMFRESKKILKTTPRVLFFVNLVPRARKSKNKIQGRTLIVTID